MKYRVASLLWAAWLVGCGGSGESTPRAELPTSPVTASSTLEIPPAAAPDALAVLDVAVVERMNPGHRKMLEALRAIASRANDDNVYTGDREARRLRAVLETAAQNKLTPVAILKLHRELAEAELDLGRERESIAQFQLAVSLSQNLYGTVPPQLLFRMGIAYLRLGETQNCCLRETANSCILPIQGDAVHSNTEGSTKARDTILRVLRGTPDDSEVHYQSLWLLNIAAMTLGEHPSGIPERFRIPATAFESGVKFPRFENVARSSGVNRFSTSGGAIGDDFDNDGSLDLIVSSWHTAEQIRFLRNDLGGSFADDAEAAGLMGIVGGLNLIHADYNNDGFVDFIVLRGGWLGRAGAHPNSLLRNNGDGTFTDVTFDSLLADENYPTQTATWIDLNNDGSLDIFVGNEHAPSQMFVSQGDGTFADIAKHAGTTNDRFAKSTVAGDFNADGWTDIYVSNLGGDNRLYQNNHNQTFTDVAQDLGVTGPKQSFPSWFWDYDNDGHLDLYVSAFTGTIDQVAKNYLGLPLDVDLNQLYRSDGEGGFTEVAKSLGLTRPTAPMGSNFGDLDNDGFLDFYLGTGNVDYMNVIPNLMYANIRGQRFEDVTTAGRFGHLQKGHGIVFADFDKDGDQDVFSQMGGALPGDRFYDSLYENPGNDNHWISLRLHGRIANRSALGARIRVVIIDGGEPRSVFKHVNSGGSFGANPLAQHIGLGAAEGIESVHIQWPGGEAEQTISEAKMDRHYDVVQTIGTHPQTVLEQVR